MDQGALIASYFSSNVMIKEPGSIPFCEFCLGLMNSHGYRLPAGYFSTQSWRSSPEEIRIFPGILSAFRNIHLVHRYSFTNSGEVPRRSGAWVLQAAFFDFREFPGFLKSVRQIR
jgi:hypothetical protein